MVNLESNFISPRNWIWGVAVFLFLIWFFSPLLVKSRSLKKTSAPGRFRKPDDPESLRKVGEAFEKWIGALLEKDGWTIFYEGIDKGKKDGGIDLIGKRDGITALIQCKFWKGAKVIHEKDLNQLRGALERYKVDHPGETVHGTFITTARLSQEARRVAEIHNIEVIEQYRF